MARSAYKKMQESVSVNDTAQHSVNNKDSNNKMLNKTSKTYSETAQIPKGNTR